MHELSVANSIIEHAINVANENNASDIKEIELEIGSMSGIDKDSFSFVMSCLKDSSGFNNCNIKIIYLENYYECTNCETKHNEGFNGENCSICNNGILILKGNSDVKIKSILIE